MGMAAGQARLLSITSRMSDNELRAQLINNDKMRLATQSSQVSEAYVAALNEAQLMFTNYDADNNASYQQLSFNSLTAYNQYNNQYGLVTPSGQILVSESDALNFQNSGGDLNTFLGYYGLEETTTYFDDLAQYENNAAALDATNPDGTVLRGDNKDTIKYYTGNTYLTTDAAGTWIEAAEEADSNMSAEELGNMYFGDETTPSYAETVSTQLYHDYMQGITNLQIAQEEFIATTGPLMASNPPLNAKPTITAADDTNMLNLYNFANDCMAVTNSQGAALIRAIRDECVELDQYGNVVGGLSKPETKVIDIEIIDNQTIDYFSTSNTGADPDVTLNNCKIVKDKNTGELLYAFKQGYPSDIFIFYGGQDKNSSNVTIDIWEATSAVPNVVGALCNYTDTGDGSYEESITITPGILGNPAQCTYSYIDYNANLNQAKQAVDNIEDIVLRYANPLQCHFSPSNDAEYNNYADAGIRLYSALFGENPPTDSSGKYNIDFSNLLDPDWVQNALNTGSYNAKDGTAHNISPNATFNNTKDNFEDIQNALMLDNIMSTYGEPKWAWIDMTAPTDSYNENGEAKAQWYTNLFERMQKGYKVLQDGLASSTEWIQFALESGIVTMEQVDSDNHWIATNYTNCSDITEQTNNAAATLAEAEYNAAMNKIENKDKKYDLELKNIDTEHNSLQTEYDSIKSAIDKNIERTFKIYS